MLAVAVIRGLATCGVTKQAVISRMCTLSQGVLPTDANAARWRAEGGDEAARNLGNEEAGRAGRESPKDT